MKRKRGILFLIILMAIGFASVTTALDTSSGIRPSISLKPNIKVVSGNGSQTRPYILSLEEE